MSVHHIGHKLDFLMRLTDTRNNQLAKVLGFDSSHISRIRSNERGLPHNRAFIEPASRYFAQLLREPYQLKGARDTICPDRSWPQSEDEQTALIATWLQAGDITEPILSPETGQLISDRTQRNAVSFYFGSAGKRECVERLLETALHTPEKPELLLYSDEGIGWMTEDPVYAKRLTELLSAYLRMGGKIRIIHCISRDLGEMLVGLRQWLPLYLLGNIEAYYCTRVRDGIFLNTRAVAKGTAAVAAHSVRGQKGNQINFYVDAPGAVASAEEEFYALLALCRPLLKFYSPADARELNWELENLEDAPGNIISAARTPLIFTLPDAVAESLARRCTRIPLRRAAAAKTRYERLFAQGFTVTEMLHLPDLEKARAGQVAPPVAEMLGEPELCYTREELALHMRGVLELLRREPLYRVVLTRSLPKESSLVVKECVGAMLFSASAPSSAFSIRELPLTGVLWEYLNRSADTMDRPDVMDVLENYILELER
ncbi:MAG: hypothetical protein IJU29_07715 [Oscillospiraceae bacterium]|nr:hypothetical protein [Oscillospiraceae bacterium]